MKPRKKPLDILGIAFIAGGLFVSGMAVAYWLPAAGDGNAVAGERPLPPIFASDGLAVVDRFASVAGLEGIVLKTAGAQPLLAYLTDDGHVLIGSLFDANGKNLTAEHAAQYIPAPDHAKLWEQAERSFWVAEPAGTADAKSVVYVFLDANCPYCKLAWQALQPYRAAGLEIRWIPVAFLAEDSLAKGVQLLDAKTPEEVEARLEGFLTNDAPSDVLVLDGSLAGKVDANNALMQEMGFQGTPVVLYRDAEGVVQVKQGMFQLSEIPEMTGLDAIEDDSPELAQFR